MMDHNHIDLEARGHQAVSKYIMTIAYMDGLVQDSYSSVNNGVTAVLH